MMDVIFSFEVLMTEVGVPLGRSSGELRMNAVGPLMTLRRAMEPTTAQKRDAMRTQPESMYVMMEELGSKNYREEVAEKLAKAPTKTYHPKHDKEYLAEYKGTIPFPDTGLEHNLLFLLLARKSTGMETTDEYLVEAALKAPVDREIYVEADEDRFYLPENIERLPEDERPAAVLKLLRKIESSHDFLRNLDLLPEPQLPF